MTATGIGASVRRKEDQRFITGKGRYVDDYNRPGQAYAYFLRSPHAHATIRGIDTAAAAGCRRRRHPDRRGPGGRQGRRPDLRLDDPFQGRHADEGGAHPALAQGKVRYVGDHVAVVIAETLAQAKDAAEAITVDYDVLPAVVETAKAAGAGTVVHDVAPDNTVFNWHLGNQSDVEAAFARAAHVTKLDIVNNRLVPNPIEPRAAVGEYDEAEEAFTLYTTSQNPHVARLVLSAFIGIAPENKLRVVAPDVGGGFGSKIFIYAEETICVWAAKKVGRPVNGPATAPRRSCATRMAATTSPMPNWRWTRAARFWAQGPHHRQSRRLSVDLLVVGADLPLRAAAVGPVQHPGDLLRGRRRLHQHRAGRCLSRRRAAEATFVIERLVEVAARELNQDPAKFRRKNYIKSFPHQTPVIMMYDGGDYSASLDKALEIADHKGFARRRRESARNGKLRGIGFSSYIEACGIAPSQAVGSLGAGVGLGNRPRCG